MARQDTSAMPRTYGAWRRQRGYELAGLSLKRFGIVAGCMMIGILLFNAGIAAVLVWAAISGLIILYAVIPFGRATLFERTVFHIRGRLMIAAGRASLYGGPLTSHPRRNRLPGVLSPLVPVAAEDGRGGHQVLVHNRATGFISAIVRVAPVGITLADRTDADAWVASYGGFLAELGYKPMVASVAMTVESAPTGGATQRDYVRERMEPHRGSAPGFATAVLDELVSRSAAATADVTTTVTINFDPSRLRPEPSTMEEAAAEVVRWLPAMENSLSACGATVIGRAQLGWLIRRVRMAFDPDARGEASRQLEVAEADEVLRWQDAGPIRAEEAWRSYRHDSGISFSWVLDAPPTGHVQNRILLPMLSPGRFPRRVSIVYTPMPASVATRKVEEEINAGNVRGWLASKSKKDETQRDIEDRRRALLAAQEEALGAGVGSFTMYVTTTVSDPRELPAAIADVEERAGQAKLRLRPCHGAQAAGFAASMGLGIDPAAGLKRQGAERWQAA
ncbi:SCO6880 family protein [Lolliginicoccus levis]|uniref:SCO6880 family protein n=1 Tax=Lolliginicoccus levis TaxID=2919542 RepID=UPI00241D01E0|nr:SCO6880 family protein [Lolliginicoccus levis]